MEIQNKMEEAADLIVEAVKFAAVAGVNASEFGIRLSESLYLNIRDAMFHYKALCDQVRDGKEEDAWRHYFNLKEHLIRGEKDAIIVQAQAVSEAVFSIMEQAAFDDLFDSDDRKELQSRSHQVKDIILRVRIAGSDLPEEEFSVSELRTEVVSCTVKAAKICEEKNLSLWI
mgnify:FL=1